MRARFIGDPNDNFSGPECITFWGVEFVKGEWERVTNPRFASNNHFEVEGGVSLPADPEDGLEGLKVPELKALAAERGVDLSGVTKKADIIAALELAAEAEEGA